ncbi:hypothetical protein IFM89_001496, partial [Coptis chinensis]
IFDEADRGVAEEIKWCKAINIMDVQINRWNGHEELHQIRENIPEAPYEEHFAFIVPSIDDILHVHNLSTSNRFMSSICRSNCGSRCSKPTHSPYGGKCPRTFTTSWPLTLNEEKLIEKYVTKYQVTVPEMGQDLVIGNIGDSRAIPGTRDQDGSLIAIRLICRS